MFVLTIRDSQQAALAAVARKRFEQDMVTHIERMFPSRVRQWVGAETAAFVHRNLLRGEGHGLVTNGALSCFLELLIQFGEEFDRSPDSEQAQDILQDADLPGQIKITLLSECLTERTGGRQIIEVQP